MTMQKEDVIKFISKLPDDYTMDEIMAELYFKQQVEEGLRVAEEGRVYTHEQVKNMVQEWRKSSGRLSHCSIPPTKLCKTSEGIPNR